MSETLPGCLGLFEAPIPPNGPCNTCRHREICKHVTKRFVAKEILRPILARLKEIENSIK